MHVSGGLNFAHADKTSQRSFIRQHSGNKSTGECALHTDVFFICFKHVLLCAVFDSCVLIVVSLDFKQ